MNGPEVTLPVPGAERPRRRLGTRLLRHVVLVNLALSLLLATGEVLLEWRQERHALQGVFVLVQSGYLGPIEYGLWNFEHRQVQVQLEAIRALPDVRYAEILTSSGEQLSAGLPSREGPTLEKSFGLYREGMDLGRLKVVLSTEGVRQRVLGRAALFLGESFAALLVLSGLVLFLLHRMVTRHLEALARQARDLDLQGLDRPFTLQRAAVSRRVDELDDVVGALNEMRISLKAGLARQEHARAELEIANSRLSLAKAAAEDADRAKSNFLANMGHELKTPLNHVVLYAELLEEELRQLGHAELVPDLQKIRNAGTHLSEILGDLLDMARLEAGKAFANPTRVDLAAFLEDLAAVARPMAEQGGNAFKLSADPELGWIRMDAPKLRQILLNLLGNAFRFTSRGMVGLEVRREEGPEGRRLRFTVRDTGPGISPERLARLFIPFHQLEQPGTRAPGGTGLGLPLCDRLCRLLGGTITVESAEGQGSAFTVFLPHVPAPPESSPEGGERRTHRLLVVDDDAFFREGMVRSLDGEGFVVESAPDGESALLAAKARRPDAIALDLMMPGMDGWDVLRRLKADPQLAPIPVLVLTALDLDAEQHLRLRGQAEAVLRKGLFRKDELVRMVHRLVLSTTSE